MEFFKNLLVCLFLVVLVFLFFQTKKLKQQTKSNFVECAYVVQKGDSLEKISKNYEVGVSQLREINGFEKGRFLIFPGQIILIPKKPQSQEKKESFFLRIKEFFGEEPPDILEPKPLEF